MLSGIDHIVVLVRDLPTAVAGYERLGFTVTPGGEHAGGATHNALIGFDDGTYFELIAFKEPERKQDHRWWPRLVAGEGLVDFALIAGEAAAVASEARERGLELSKVVDGSRHRPDGVLIAWRSITPGLPIGTTPLPFAIEDVTPRDARVPNGDAAKHALQVRGVAELVVAVRDVTAAARDLAAMLGHGLESAQVSGTSAEVVFKTGAHRLRLLEPPAAPPHDGIGLSVAEHLEQRGEGPYEVVLDVESASGTLLPIGDAMGARIRIGTR